MNRTGFILLTIVFTLNTWADSIAESQAKAKQRYRDFISKIKEDAADDKLNSLEVSRIKAQRAQSEELREKARREYIASREARRKREVSSEMRDKILEAEIEKEKQRSQEAAKIFLRQQELIKKALNSVPQVDPHDEYEVGKHYLDESGELEEEDTPVEE